MWYSLETTLADRKHICTVQWYRRRAWSVRRLADEGGATRVGGLIPGRDSERISRKTVPKRDLPGRRKKKKIKEKNRCGRV